MGTSLGPRRGSYANAVVVDGKRREIMNMKDAREGVQVRRTGMDSFLNKDDSKYFKAKVGRAQPQMDATSNSTALLWPEA